MELTIGPVLACGDQQPDPPRWCAGCGPPAAQAVDHRTGVRAAPPGRRPAASVSPAARSRARCDRREPPVVATTRTVVATTRTVVRGSRRSFRHRRHRCCRQPSRRTVGLLVHALPVRSSAGVGCPFAECGEDGVVVGNGFERHERLDAVVVHDDLVVHGVDQRAPVCTSTSVTSASQREDSRGVSSGTGTTSIVRPSMAATRRIISR